MTEKPSEQQLTTATTSDRSPAQNTAQNTARAYAADWTHFSRWCRMTGHDALTPSPKLISLYLSDQATPSDGLPGLTLATLERRLSGLVWNCQKRGITLDRKDPQISSMLDEIRGRAGATAPTQKAALSSDDIHAMVATLPFDLRGLRDRAILLIGYAAGLRRSEIVNLDRHKDAASGAAGSVEIFNTGLVLTLTGKTGWREIEIIRRPRDQFCPVHALEHWLDFARISAGPVFRRTTRDGRRALDARLSDRSIARLIKQTVLKSGICPEVPEKDRLALFSGESLRMGPVAQRSRR